MRRAEPWRYREGRGSTRGVGRRSRSTLRTAGGHGSPGTRRSRRSPPSRRSSPGSRTPPAPRGDSARRPPLRDSRSTEERARGVHHPGGNEEGGGGLLQRPAQARPRRRDRFSEQEQGGKRSRPEGGHREESPDEPVGGGAPIHPGARRREERGVDQPAREQPRRHSEGEGGAWAARLGRTPRDPGEDAMERVPPLDPSRPRPVS